MGETPFGWKIRPVKEGSQLPKIGAVKCLFSVEKKKPLLVGGGF
jgi:hypothetical protein